MISFKNNYFYFGISNIWFWYPKCGFYGYIRLKNKLFQKNILSI